MLLLFVRLDLYSLFVRIENSLPQTREWANGLESQSTPGLREKGSYFPNRNTTPFIYEPDLDPNAKPFTTSYVGLCDGRRQWRWVVAVLMAARARSCRALGLGWEGQTRSWLHHSERRVIPILHTPLTEESGPVSLLLLEKWRLWQKIAENYILPMPKYNNNMFKDLI